MRIFGGHNGSRQAAFLQVAIFALGLLLSPLLASSAMGEAQGFSPTTPDSEIVLTLELDGEYLSDSFIGIQRSDRVFLPVCAVAEAASLAVKCTSNGAYGFLVRESRPFAIDLKENYVISGREVFGIRRDVFAQGEELFADLESLSRWWPVDFIFSKENSTVRMHAREVLPVQGLMKRQKSRRLPPVERQRICPDFTSPRQAVSMPTVDWTSQASLYGKGRSGQKATMLNAMSLAGDLLYMSGEAHLWAHDDDLKRLDVTLFRRSDAAFRIGPVPVTRLLIGTMQVPGIDGIGALSVPMQGISLSNRPISVASKFLSHDVNGHLPAGWDAELFHNGVAVGYQPPNQEQTYRFDGIRLRYGINEFKIVLHGPFGETREMEQVIVSDAVTPSGELLYTMSAGQETGWSGNGQSGSDTASNLTATADFGLAKGITGSALLVRQTDDLRGEQTHAGVGMRTALGFTLLSMDLIHSFSPENGGGGQLVAIRSSSVFSGGALQVEQRFLNDFLSLHYPMTDDPVLSQTFAKWGSSMTGWKNLTIPLSMELGMETRESGATDWTTAFRGTAGWKGWTGTLEGYLSRLRTGLYSGAMLQVSTKAKGVSVRGQLGVSMAPSLAPSLINLTADRELGAGYLMNAGVLHDPASNNSELRLGLSKRYGMLGYSVFGTASTTGVYTVNVGLNTSVAADVKNRQVVVSAEALAPAGMISVSATTPSDAGSPGKEVPGVAFLLNDGRAPVVTGSRGIPVIAFLQPDVPVDVTVDVSTLVDPFMVPAETGCRITPRSGVVSVCNFTMTTGGEIDGMIFISLKSGEVPLKGVRVDLLAEGAAGATLQSSTGSEESGYYLFKTVKPGRYQVVVPETELMRLKAAARPIGVTMPAGGDLVSGQDIILQPTGPTAGKALGAAAAASD